MAQGRKREVFGHLSEAWNGLVNRATGGEDEPEPWAEAAEEMAAAA
jgi:hypothetical protein